MAKKNDIFLNNHRTLQRRFNSRQRSPRDIS